MILQVYPSIGGYNCKFVVFLTRPGARIPKYNTLVRLVLRFLPDFSILN